MQVKDVPAYFTGDIYPEFLPQPEAHHFHFSIFRKMYAYSQMVFINDGSKNLAK